MSPASGSIAVNLITGFLGVGKTTAIRRLLAGHPPDETWAVLVNEFGEISVDGALLAESGVVVHEVAGGCLCCVAAPAFSTGLNRIIRLHRPDRILVEPSGLGHPAQVLATLTGPLYAHLLEVCATLCLIDPRHLASSRHREHPNFQDQVHLADALIANKVDLCSPADLAAFEAFVSRLHPAKERMGLVEHGDIDPHWLDITRSESRRATFPEAHAFLVDNDEQVKAAVGADWLVLEGRGDGYRRVGWTIRPSKPWPIGALQDLMDGMAVERKKGLFLTTDGWVTMNQSTWHSVSAPSDGRMRLALIDPQPLDAQRIDARLKALAGG